MQQSIVFTRVVHSRRMRWFLPSECAYKLTSTFSFRTPHLHSTQLIQSQPSDKVNYPQSQCSCLPSS